MGFSEIVSTVSASIWGMPFIIVCLGTGIYFSVRTRFLQIRYLRSMWKMLLQDKSSKNELSSFQSPAGFAKLWGYGATFVAITLFFFTFTTLVSYYFQGGTNIFYLFRKKGSTTTMINVLLIVMLAATFYTAIHTMPLAWDLTDIGVGIMAWLNIIAILLLQKTIFKTFKDYERQRKQGIKDLIFDPQKMNIFNADEWNKIK